MKFFFFPFFFSFLFFSFLPYCPRRLGKTWNDKIPAREPYFCGINTTRSESWTINSLNRMSTFRTRFEVFPSIFFQKCYEVRSSFYQTFFRLQELFKYWNIRLVPLSRGVCELCNDILRVLFGVLVRSFSNANDIWTYLWASVIYEKGSLFRAFLYPVSIKKSKLGQLAIRLNLEPAKSANPTINRFFSRIDQ